ncbi:unnamed protein product [Triticum turgidum subsp. durum]|uniref:Uncharacterized protein n=2 Tax=Triticum turgidum subsp. durum TaxID=4567 RepID=A0A9R0RY47_TRITD|nr:unnamed protein product [Triticum turgidum subsp. durum]
MKGGGDIEAGTAAPKGTTESPELRWALIRKIYVVLCLQLLLTAAVAVVFVRVRAIPHFFVSSYAGLGLYIFILIFPFIVLCHLLKCLLFLRSAVPAAHLPPEAPNQLAASWRLHSGHQLLCGLDMCLYQWYSFCS